MTFAHEFQNCFSMFGALQEVTVSFIVCLPICLRGKTQPSLIMDYREN
jgi:hypothetical protein